MIIELQDVSIEIIRKSIKNINLRIYPPDGRVKVSIPLHYSDRLIRQHLLEKSSWIKEQSQRIREQSVDATQPLQTGSTLPFKGKNYLLIIEEHHGPAHITVNEELIYCYTSPHASVLQKQTLIDRWYKKEMRELLPNLINHWQEIIPVKVKEWGIKKMKTRWGSCNTRDQRIWLNLSLIKKPLVCLEYVLVHELIHLLEASHNQRFYRLMTQYMPKWREYQYLLEGKHRALGK